jgi:hypothetical protein
MSAAPRKSKPPLTTSKEVAEYLDLPVRMMGRAIEIPAIQIGSLYRYRWTDVDNWLNYISHGAWPGGAPLTDLKSHKDVTRALASHRRDAKRHDELLQRRRARKAAKEAGLSIKRILITEDALRLVLAKFLPKDKVSMALYEVGTAAIEVTEPDEQMKAAKKLAREKGTL